MELYWCSVLGILCFFVLTCLGTSEDANLFRNHRRNRILLMKDEVFNFPATSDVTTDQHSAAAATTETTTDGEYSAKNSDITAKRDISDVKKQHQNKKRRNEKVVNKENRKRKLHLVETKEVIPSVMFSHNGTYKFGASPKVVQNATISYKTSPQEKKKTKIENQKRKIPAAMKEVIPSVMFSHNGTYKFGASPKIVQNATIKYKLTPQEKKKFKIEKRKRKLHAAMKEVIPSVMFSHNGTYKFGASPKIVQNATIKYKLTPQEKKKFKIEKQKRKIPAAMKEVIPSVMFSHNGTYKFGASPKIVQNATIKYKTTPLEKKKFSVTHNQEEVGTKRQIGIPPFNQTGQIQKRKMVAEGAGWKKKLPYFPTNNDTAAIIGAKRHLVSSAPLNEISKPFEHARLIQFEAVAHFIPQHKNQKLIL